MPSEKRAPQTQSNAGDLKVKGFDVKGFAPLDAHKREDFFHDLKKVVRKLPPDHPSRSDSQKR